MNAKFRDRLKQKPQTQQHHREREGLAGRSPLSGLRTREGERNLVGN